METKQGGQGLQRVAYKVRLRELDQLSLTKKWQRDCRAMTKYLGGGYRGDGARLEGPQ